MCVVSTRGRIANTHTVARYHKLMQPHTQTRELTSSILYLVGENYTEILFPPNTHGDATCIYATLTAGSAVDIALSHAYLFLLLNKYIIATVPYMRFGFLPFPTLLFHPFPQPFKHFLFILAANTLSDAIMKCQLSTRCNMSL